MSIRTVIGIHSCKEALIQRRAHELKKLYIKQDSLKNPALKEIFYLAQSKHLKPEMVSSKKMNRLLGQTGESHQGLLLEVDHSFNWVDFQELSKEPESVVLILDRIQDPKNLGAILRTAWLMSVKCLFISSRKSVGLTPSVIKAASGAVEHVPIFVKDNLQQVLTELKKQQFWIYALDMSAKQKLWDEDLKGKKAFLIGGEQSGARASLKSRCDKVLCIPQKQDSASYNVSVATAVALFENLRQKSLNTT